MHSDLLPMFSRPRLGVAYAPIHQDGFQGRDNRAIFTNTDGAGDFAEAVAVIAERSCMTLSASTTVTLGRDARNDDMLAVLSRTGIGVGAMMGFYLNDIANEISMGWAAGTTTANWT